MRQAASRGRKWANLFVELMDSHSAPIERMSNHPVNIIDWPVSFVIIPFNN
jgi:hypothetical protein